MTKAAERERRRARAQARRNRRNALAALVVVILLAAIVALVLSSDDDGGRGEDTAASGPGAVTYSQNCAACHGPSGEGGTGPTLAGAVEARFPDVDDQVAFIESGAPLVGMPAFEDALSADQIRAVAEYTRSLP